jgi:hypothetical protein
MGFLEIRNDHYGPFTNSDFFKQLYYIFFKFINTSGKKSETGGVVWCKTYPQILFDSCEIIKLCICFCLSLKDSICFYYSIFASFFCLFFLDFVRLRLLFILS